MRGLNPKPLPPSEERPPIPTAKRADRARATARLADDESSGEDQPESEEQPTTAIELEGISSSHDSVREDDGQATTITLTITLDKAAAADETITLEIVSPTQGKTAKRGEDFDATLDETITITKGQRTGTAQLTLTPKGQHDSGWR